jgi:hypothetical protein
LRQCLQKCGQTRMKTKKNELLRGRRKSGKQKKSERFKGDQKKKQELIPLRFLDVGKGLGHIKTLNTYTLTSLLFWVSGRGLIDYEERQCSSCCNIALLCPRVYATCLVA